jgi:hypothetical protein
VSLEAAPGNPPATLYGAEAISNRRSGSAAAFLVAQRPSFWIAFGSRLAKALLPLA